MRLLDRDLLAALAAAVVIVASAVYTDRADGRAPLRLADAQAAAHTVAREIARAQMNTSWTVRPCVRRRSWIAWCRMDYTGGAHWLFGDEIHDGSDRIVVWSAGRRRLMHTTPDIGLVSRIANQRQRDPYQVRGGLPIAWATRGR